MKKEKFPTLFWTSAFFGCLVTRRRFLGGNMWEMRGSSHPLNLPMARHRPSRMGTVEVQSDSLLFCARGLSWPWLSSTIPTRVSNNSTWGAYLMVRGT